MPVKRWVEPISPYRIIGAASPHPASTAIHACRRDSAAVVWPQLAVQCGVGAERSVAIIFEKKYSRI